MPRWRKEAFERLPECRKQLQEEESLYVYFHVLQNVLWQAHLREDEGLIQRIYDYAQWCLTAPRGKDSSDDLLTIVTVSFFEHLPTHKEVRRAVGQFLPRSLIEDMKDVFLHHGTEEKYREMIASCDLQKKKANQPPQPTPVNRRG